MAATMKTGVPTVTWSNSHSASGIEHADAAVRLASSRSTPDSGGAVDADARRR